MISLFKKLSMTNIFNGLGEDTIMELFDKKPFQLKQYNRDEYIAYSRDICNDLLIVVEGSVRGEMNDFSGKKLKTVETYSAEVLGNLLDIPDTKCSLDHVQFK